MDTLRIAQRAVNPGPVVLVISADALLSSALARLVGEESGLEVIESCATSNSGIALACRDSRAEVVIIDMGADATATQAALGVLLSEAHPRGVIAVASSNSAEAVAQLFTAGVRGVVARDAAPAELLTAVHEVAVGHMFASRTAMRLVVEHLRLADAGTPRWRLLDHEQLSERERDAVGLLARGMSNKEIAQQMFVSAATVKVHLSHAMSKWGVRDRVQLVIRALNTEFAHQDLRARIDSVPVRSLSISRPSVDRPPRMARCWSPIGGCAP